MCETVGYHCISNKGSRISELGHPRAASVWHLVRNGFLGIEIDRGRSIPIWWGNRAGILRLFTYLFVAINRRGICGYWRTRVQLFLRLTLKFTEDAQSNCNAQNAFFFWSQTRWTFKQAKRVGWHLPFIFFSSLGWSFLFDWCLAICHGAVDSDNVTPVSSDSEVMVLINWDLWALISNPISPFASVYGLVTV